MMIILLLLLLQSLLVFRIPSCCCLLLLFANTSSLYFAVAIPLSPAPAAHSRFSISEIAKGAGELRAIQKGSKLVSFVQSTVTDEGDANEIELAAPLSIKTHKKAMLLSVLLWASLVCTLGGYFECFKTWDLFIVILGFYLLESFCCSTNKYLSNILDLSMLEKFSENLILASPLIRWYVECYHHTHVYNKNGSTRRKAVTHSATQDVICERWRDTTQKEIPRMVKDVVERAPYVKITLTPIIRFTDNDVLLKYQHELTKFLHLNRRDEEMDFKTTIELKGFQPKVLVSTTGIGAPSTGLARRHFFWIFTFVGLTVPYRIWFSRHCATLQVLIEKEVAEIALLRTT